MGLRRRSPEELALHKAGDHTFCSPDRPGHGTCSQCGKTIQVSRNSAPPERRRCRDCQQERPRKPAGDRAPRVCELCEQSYVPKPFHRPDQRFCSKSCTRAWQNGKRPPYVPEIVIGGDYLAHRQAKSRARRLRHAQTWDGITDEEILERDGWRCQIPDCKRRPIRKDLKYPHPGSKSIDHIIPLAHGGDDTAVNKRAAHLRCNTRRSSNMARGGEQIGLFGVIREPPLVTRTHNGATTQPRAPRVCDICGEPLAAGKCRLHLPVCFVACGHCGRWFTARPQRGRQKRYCSKFCQKQHSTTAKAPMSEEARARKRQRDRERRWVDPAYRARALAATARWHDRQRAAAAAAPAGQMTL